MKNPRTPRTPVLLPATPLHRCIRTREILDGSLKAVSEKIALRLGCSVVAANRNVFRILKSQEVDMLLADKMVGGMGMHLSELYGDEWLKGVSA